MVFWDAPNLSWTFMRLVWTGWGQNVAKGRGRYRVCDAVTGCSSGNVRIRLLRLKPMQCGDEETPTYYYTGFGITSGRAREEVHRFRLYC